MGETRGPAGGDDVVVEFPRWTIDPRVRQALTLQTARNSLESSDPSSALALAEELLDTDPDDVEALLIVAIAAPRCGHAEVGVLASMHLRRRGQDPGAVEASALFAAGRIPEALLAAEQAVEQHAEDPLAHSVHARIFYLLGDVRQATAALLRAAELDPIRHPIPLELRPEEWDELLVEALSALSPHQRGRARELEIRFEAIPDLDDLRAASRPFPCLPPTVDGLLVQLPAPAVLKLYCRNLTFGSETTADVVERMRVVLEGELAGKEP